MTGLLSTLPLWAVALAIFLARTIDVTIGTVRTLAVVQGRTAVAFLLGFVEVCIWFIAVTEAVVRIGEAPWLLFAFAGGFAVGNVVGIQLERRLALGSCVVRMISTTTGSLVADAVRPVAQMITTFDGRGDDGPRLLVYALCLRRDLPELLERAQNVDPVVFYAVERFAETRPLAPTFQPTGWRSSSKKK